MSRIPHALALAALVAGCTSKTVPITITLVTKSCGSLDPMANVTSFRVRAYGDGISPPLQTVTNQTGSGNSLVLPNIPAGTNRQIEVVGFNGDPSSSTSSMVSAGRTSLFTVPKSVDSKAPPLQFTIFLRPMNQFTPVCDASNPDQSATMASPRAAHTATVLQDGRVFILGGYNAATPAGDGGVGENAWTSTSGAELYDPNAGTFGPAQSISSARAFHTATLLPDGTVLIIGGEQKPSNIHTDTWTYDVTQEPSGTPWNPGPGTVSQSSATGRSRHSSFFDSTAGRSYVVSIGGNSQDTTSGQIVNNTSIEWYDPTVTPPAEKRDPSAVIPGWVNFGSTSFLDNSAFAVAFAGGESDTPCPSAATCLDGTACTGDGGVCNDVYACPPNGVCLDGVTQCAFDAGPPSQCTDTYACAPRCKYDSATCSPDGTCAQYYSSAQYIGYNANNPTTGAYEIAQLGTVYIPESFRTVSIGAACAQFLSSNSLLCCGGHVPDSIDLAQCTAANFHPDGNIEQLGIPAVPQLTLARTLACAVTLQDGRVLIAGGLSTANGSQVSANNAELYSGDWTTLPRQFPNQPPASQPALGLMTTPRYFHQCTLLSDGSVLVTGGINQSGTSVQTTNTAEIFQPGPLN